MASCEYKEKLTYVEQSAKKPKGNKKHKRNIIWFNPPYSKTVKTNIGKYFFRLINKHFSPEHKFHKVFNKNTLKLSYSCMPNLKSQINSHNQNIFRAQPQSTPKTYNCLKKEGCPMNGFCLTKSLLYYATITCDKENYTKPYKGICETTFKKRYVNHKKSFNVPTYKNDTKLSTEYWALKTKQLHPKVSWQIKRRYNSYNPISRRCNLCLNEKLEILDDQDKNLLNKRSEIISHCHHENKFKLKALASNTADTDIT